MKIKEIVAVIGTYTDQTGAVKNNYRQVGELHKKQDGGFFILMDKSFNLAAVQQKNPADVKVVLSCYDPKPKQGAVTAGQYRAAKEGTLPPEQVHASFASQAPTDEFDDSIPF